MPFVGFIFLLELIHLQDEGLNLPIQVAIYFVGGLELYCQLFDPAQDSDVSATACHRATEGLFVLCLKNVGRPGCLQHIGHLQELRAYLVSNFF